MLALYERSSCAAIANRMTSRVITIKIIRFHATVESLATFEREKNTADVHASPSESGTDTTRILLSALPETRSVDDGLKCRVVGGNSCTFRIVSRG